MESIHAREGLRPLTHHRRQRRPSVKVSDEVGTDNERSSARPVKGRRRRKKKTLRKRAPRYRTPNGVPKDDSDSSDDDDDDGGEGGSRLPREFRRKTATGRVSLPPEESKTVKPSGAMWSEGGGSDYSGGDEKSTLAARPNHGFIMPIIKITYADNDLEDIYGFDNYEDLIQEQWTNNQAYGYVRPNDEVHDVAKEKNEKRPVDSGRTKKNQENVQRKKYDPRKYINNKVRGRKRKTHERDRPLTKVQDQTVTKQTTEETRVENQTVTKQTTEETKVQDQTVTKQTAQETKVQDQTVTKQKTQETLPIFEKEALPAIFDESAEEDTKRMPVKAWEESMTR
ncbi:uncharacterized protein LOC135209322 [Macrobrachium nipponense]|uniref:uncharacterized protein LOC135209322 n=1 Tax=Macrobrachium nipponense TaxID=159736 RepID=UPI0030C813B0